MNFMRSEPDSMFAFHRNVGNSSIVPIRLNRCSAVRKNGCVVKSIYHEVAKHTRPTREIIAQQMSNHSISGNIPSSRHNRALPISRSAGPSLRIGSLASEHFAVTAPTRFAVFFSLPTRCLYRFGDYASISSAPDCSSVHEHPDFPGLSHRLPDHIPFLTAGYSLTPLRAGNYQDYQLHQQHSDSKPAHFVKSLIQRNRWPPCPAT